MYGFVLMFWGQDLLAQRDTLREVLFPYQKGYHQTFTGFRLTEASGTKVPVHFYQEVAEDSIIDDRYRKFLFYTYSEIGKAPMKGYYYLTHDVSGTYRWHAGSEWHYILVPPVLYKGLKWKTKQAGQKYYHQIVKTDTIIETPFGSHRCFVVRSDVLNQYFEGRKHRSATWDFYDTTLGKVKSVTITWLGKGRKEVFRELIELTDYGIGK